MTRRRMLLAAGAGLAGAIAGCARSRPRIPLLTDRDVTVPPEPTLFPPDAPPTGGDLPTVMPRTAWTSGDPRLWLANPMGGISHITIHHDGMPPVKLTTRGQVAERIELIRRAHLRHGWADIGYHYIVDPQGYVWQGRPRRLQGAHVKDHNEHNLGIVVLGNFIVEYPTPAALHALDAFIVGNMRLFGVPTSRVHTHQELNPTACPGTHLQSHMDQARARAGVIASLL